MGCDLTPIEFNKLPFDEKGNYLWLNGHYLTNRIKYNHYQAALYQLHGFYVEVIYNIPGNEIEVVRALKSSDQLDQYLDKIDIRALM